MSTDAELLAIRMSLEGSKEVVRETEAVRDSMGRLRDEQGRFVKGSEEMDRKTSGAFESIGRAGKKMQKTGQGMTLGMTLPLVGIGTLAVKTAGDYERSMTQVQVATGASERKMASLDSLAKELGASSKFSAGESAEAMLELAKSGMAPAQIQGGALKATMDLAAAGAVELTAAANLTGAAMNTFELKAGRAKSIADALAGGANASAADVTDLAEALSQGGSSAAAYGLSLNEAVGSLAAFSERGIVGSDAGTSFKTFLARLNPETEKARSLMSRLGLDFFDAAGNMKKLPAIAGELRDKLAGKTQEKRESILQTLFGTDAIRGARAIYNEGSDGILRFVTATEKQGAASKMANAFMEGTAGKTEEARGAMENAALAAGAALAPAVILLAGGVAVLAEWFSGLPEPVQQFIVAGLGVVAIAGPVLVFLGMMAQGIAVVGTALTFLAANPVVLAIAALVAVGAGFYIAYQKVGWFRDGVDAVWGWIKDNWPLILVFLTGPLGAAVAFIVTHWDTVKKVSASAINSVLGFVRENWPYIVGSLLGPFGLAAGAIYKNWDAIVTFLGSLPDRAGTVLSEFASTLAGWGEAAGLAFANGLIDMVNDGIAVVNDGLDEANALSFLGVDAPNIPEIGNIDTGKGSPTREAPRGPARGRPSPRKPPRAKRNLDRSPFRLDPFSGRPINLLLPSGEVLATTVLRSGEDEAALR